MLCDGRMTYPTRVALATIFMAAALTLPGTLPVRAGSTESPIRHVVVTDLENHSFDDIPREILRSAGPRPNLQGGIGYAV